jgi:hypothetical protein
MSELLQTLAMMAVPVSFFSVCRYVNRRGVRQNEIA